MKVDELILKVNCTSKEHEYWLSVEKEVQCFFASSTVSESDKETLHRKAQLEKLYMICQGIRWETKNSTQA